MPDLKWTVHVHRWTWIYTFSRNGAVSWRDPFNGMHANGSWRMEKGKLITRWVASKTWEEWDVPINPHAATGQCHMEEGTYDLEAEALNYYLQPGDVVYVGRQIIKGNGTAASIIYPDEVRSGGTIAWICRNPGNIRQGEKYGAYKGKQLHVKKLAPYAIFPNETIGLNAVVTVLKRFGHVTINQAMHHYAPNGDGHNNPDEYARGLAKGLGVQDSAYLDQLDLTRMAKLITGVESTIEGKRWARDDPNLPEEIRGRLPGRLSPPTDEEVRNSSLSHT
jgi:hypothetical protein